MDKKLCVQQKCIEILLEILSCSLTSCWKSHDLFREDLFEVCVHVLTGKFLARKKRKDDEAVRVIWGVHGLTGKFLARKKEKDEAVIFIWGVHGLTGNFLARKNEAFIGIFWGVPEPVGTSQLQNEVT